MINILMDALLLFIRLMMRSVRSFVPGRGFHGVSVTGSRCDLQCPHCMGVPLSSMADVSVPGTLTAIARSIAGQGGTGLLLSGGCDSQGCVPLAQYCDEISAIKKTTQLLINAHVGYADPDDLSRLVDAGIDSFSVNFPLSDRFGEEYLQVGNALERYRITVDTLRTLGSRRVVPHILTGLATKEEEMAGLQFLADEGTDRLVIIAFTPLSGTPLEASRPTNEERIVWFVEHAREHLPDARIVLGCMRPRGYVAAETRLMRDTVDGIVLPAPAAERALEGEIKIERFEGCCAIYL